MAAPQMRVIPLPPLELRQRRQWVLWKREQRDDKWTKVLYHPSGNGRRAKSNDPATWGTYEQAIACYKRLAFDGVGFVFSADDPYVGVDLDDCLDDVTGIVTPQAQAIVDELASYTEITPSGRGLHILIKATLPEGRRVDHTQGIEMYSAGRFFTITGRRLANTAETIAERSQELHALHTRIFGAPVSKPAYTPMTAPSDLDDRAVYDLAARGVNGVKFQHLWRGDYTAYGSQSEADLALCNILAFYTGDPQRVDWLFRTSGLMREKWDERHFSSGQTYGEATIDKAFAGRTEVYSPQRPTPINAYAAPASASRHSDADEESSDDEDTERPLRYHFLSDDEIDTLPEQTFLIEHTIPENGITVVYGDSGSGKTFYALDQGLAVATGKPWKGRATTQGVVAYIAGEDALGVAQRRRAWKQYYERPKVPGFFLLTETVPFMDGQAVVDVIAALGKLPDAPRFVIIDTLACAMVGGDEDKTKDMTLFLEAVKRVQRTFQCTVMLVHHKNKSGGERGSVALRAAADAMYDISKDGDLMTAKCDKLKNRPIPEPMYLSMTPSGDSCVLTLRAGEIVDGRLPDTVAHILGVLRDGFPNGAAAKQWLSATGYSDPTFYRAVTLLVKHGYVNDTNGARGSQYTLTPIGKAYKHHYHHSHDSYHAQGDSDP